MAIRATVRSFATRRVYRNTIPSRVVYLLPPMTMTASREPGQGLAQICGVGVMSDIACHQIRIIYELAIIPLFGGRGRHGLAPNRATTLSAEPVAAQVKRLPCYSS